MTPLSDPGAAELDALLESIETRPEGLNRLVIPVTPEVVRILLRSEFRPGDGSVVRMVGGSLYGNEFTPMFQRREP